jgi:ketosteroid isomerase-like protein
VWSRAWRDADTDAVTTIYANDAVFYSHPFRERQRPRDYAAWAFAHQADIEFRFGEPLVAGDRASIDWWAVITSTDGSVETIAGMSRLRFDGAGLAVEQRDVWASKRGRHELPDWAR